MHIIESTKDVVFKWQNPTVYPEEEIDSLEMCCLGIG